MELVDWIYDPDLKVYINRWEKKVVLTKRHIAFYRAVTPEEINKALNDVAIALRAKGKI